MTKLPRRVLIPVIAGAVALALVAAAVVLFVVRPWDQTLASYSAAADDLRAAHATAVENQQAVAAQLGAAAATAGTGTSLAAATGPGYVADPSTVAAVRVAVDALVASAGLTVADGAVTAPEVPAIEELGSLEAPGTPEERESAAAALRERVPAIESSAATLAEQALQITAAIDSVTTAMDAVIASAHTTGTTDALPPLASADTVAAYSAAVAALAAPADDADPLALITAYQDAWLAGIASHEAAARQQASASEPTLIRGILIANKTYALPSSYGNGLTAETTAAFDTMKAAAAAEGHNLYISSGFRSYSTQNGLYNKYVANDGKADADRYSARPGHSEHQSGLAFDLNTISESFGGTPAGIWVAQHGHEYGFIVRYPQGKEAITGYKWEPWHIRYVGVDVATKLFNSGLTVEEYLGITSAY